MSDDTDRLSQEMLDYVCYNLEKSGHIVDSYLKMLDHFSHTNFSSEEEDFIIVCFLGYNASLDNGDIPDLEEKYGKKVKRLIDDIKYDIINVTSYHVEVYVWTCLADIILDPEGAMRNTRILRTCYDMCQNLNLPRLYADFNNARKEFTNKS